MSAKSFFIVQVLAASALFAAVVAVTSPAAAQAAPPVKPPGIAQTCTACHGAKGISSTRNTPSLAGQPDIFTQYQLVFMRDGQRKPGVMQAVVKNLTDENIRDLGAYYAALPPPPAFKPGRAVDEEKVAALMQPRRCGNCHKEDFSGQGETARLAGQRPEYLAKALADFRSGARRGRGMGAMIEVSTTLQDQDMQLIAAYLARKP
jgi:cytochrome c553